MDRSALTMWAPSDDKSVQRTLVEPFIEHAVYFAEIIATFRITSIEIIPDRESSGLCLHVTRPQPLHAAEKLDLEIEVFVLTDVKAFRIALPLSSEEREQKVKNQNLTLLYNAAAQ